MKKEDNQISDLIAMLASYRDYHYGRGEIAEGDMMQRRIDAIEVLQKQLETEQREGNSNCMAWEAKCEGLKGELKDTCAAADLMAKEITSLRAEVDRYRTSLKAAGIHDSIVEAIGKGDSHEPI